MELESFISGLKAWPRGFSEPGVIIILGLN